MNRHSFDVAARRWRGPSGKFIPARRGRRTSTRLDRAVELVAFRHVTAVDGGWVVLSVDGAHFYHVSLEQMACDCPDAAYRPGVRCKHAIAVALRERCLAGLLRDAP